MLHQTPYRSELPTGVFPSIVLADKGIQPVHFFSHTMTDTKKRYSQTQKDALAIKWAKERLGVYLLGATRFRIVTVHKPLLPVFNKATAKIPLRIEKWVIEMLDVDFDLIYKPGRDEEDLLDYLSRHSLPETGNDNTERTIKWSIGQCGTCDHVIGNQRRDAEI